MLIPQRIQRLGREGFWVVLGQVSAAIGSLVGVSVLTTLLQPASYGELALGMTIAVLVGQMVFGPLSNGATRFFAPALEHGDAQGYIGALRNLVTSASGLVGVVALLTVAGFAVIGRPEWAAMTLAAYLFGVLTGYESILNGIQNAARQRTVVAFHQGSAPWLRFLVAAGFVAFFRASSVSAMLGYSVATAAILASQYFWFSRGVVRGAARRGGEGRWRHRIVEYSTPFALWGIFTWGQIASARWALGYFGTLEEVGFYSALFQIGFYPMLLATTLAMQFVGPIFFQRAGDASEPTRNASAVGLGARVAGVALAMTVLATMIALVTHERLFALVVDDQYRRMSHLLPWTVLAGGLFAVGQVVSLNQMSLLKTRRLIAPKIGTALIGIALNVLGAYLYGIGGVVGASVLFSVLYLVWMLLISRDLLPSIFRS